VCNLHEEDVGFVFHGTDPDQLQSNRYYRGTVDGYAEFGVFVNIGESVTGLLHRSEIDQRLESLPYDTGDELFVKVQNVRSNGNVDLGWSIRQEGSAFRGMLVDDPETGEELVEAPDPESETQSDRESGAESETDGGTAANVAGESTLSERTDSETADTGPESTSGVETSTESSGVSGDSDNNNNNDNDSDGDAAGSETDAGTIAAATTTELASVTITALADQIGDPVQFEAAIEDIRQTSGPTVFTMSDESGTVECAAFDGAGVRAYPDVETDDIVRVTGEPEQRRGSLQVEVEELTVLDGDAQAAFVERTEAALTDRAQPDRVEPIADDPAVAAVSDSLSSVTTELRRAVFEGRPIVVRHAATVDGYAASVAIERATLPLVREEHQDPDAEYHYFDRRPIEGAVYDMDDATRDVTRMLSDEAQHDEPIPLFVFVAAGGTAESRDGLDLLGVYDASRVVVDAGAVPSAIGSSTDVLAGPADTSATALAAAVAAAVRPEAGIHNEVGHLPAVSMWTEPPESYQAAAADAGYETDEVRKLREAVALEANYQSYEDKRELIADLLFAEEEPDGLAGHISDQFRTRMTTAVETAEANAERRVPDGHDQSVLVLDTEAYTHRYEFPPDRLLLDELFRRQGDEAAAVVGVGRDEAHIRTAAEIDLRSVVETAGDQATSAALDARAIREGRVEFLAGEREAVQRALVEALADALER
jgi:Archaea-specific RecJ-like exonuclease, contains DnaJ-type Zn finger domain